MSRLLSSFLKIAGRIAALVMLAVAVLATPAMAADRVALVVGNNDYKFAPKLTNPVNDARELAKALRSGGFDVTEAYNQTSQQFSAVFDEFSKKVASARVGVVYFAGHGLQFHGSVYLVPVDVDISNERDLRKTIPADDLMQDTSRASELGVVILDACRDTPFVKQIAETVGPTRSVDLGRGLSRVSTVPRNTMLAYATQAGNVALDGDTGHSPYATALIRHLPTPRKDIRLVFGAVRDDVLGYTDGRQEPFIYGALGAKEIYLVPDSPFATANNAAANAPNSFAPSASTPPRTDVASLAIPQIGQLGALPADYVAWKKALASDSWQVLNQVSTSDGSSIFGFLAGYIDRKKPAGASPSSALAAVQSQPLPLGELSGGNISAIQRALRDVNYYGGPINGALDAETSAAIRQFAGADRGASELNIGTLVRLGERAATREPTSLLTGTWAGRYEYSTGRPGVNFMMKLIFSQGQITGSVIEPNTFGNKSSKNLYANFSGVVNGDRIQWIKKYDGTGGVGHSVAYSGRIDRAANRIVGNWKIGSNATGSFALALTP